MDISEWSLTQLGDFVAEWISNIQLDHLVGIISVGFGTWKDIYNATATTGQIVGLSDEYITVQEGELTKKYYRLSGWSAETTEDATKSQLFPLVLNHQEVAEAGMMVERIQQGTLLSSVSINKIREVLALLES